MAYSVVQGFLVPQAIATQGYRPMVIVSLRSGDQPAPADAGSALLSALALGVVAPSDAQSVASGAALGTLTVDRGTGAVVKRDPPP